MSSDTPTIGTGYVHVDAPCPECGALVDILAVIRSVLTSPEDDVSTLRLRLKAKPVDHDCRGGAQLRREVAAALAIDE